MMIVSFDVSSSAIGWACLEKSGTYPSGLKLLDSGFIAPKKKGTIFERLMMIEPLIAVILSKYKPDLVAIEDIIKYFPGKSSATSIIMLAIWNRTIGLQCAKAGYRVELCNVMAIRHGIKLNKALPSKAEMPDLVSKILSIPFPHVLNTKGKNKGLPVKQSNDIADAIAVALYAAKKF